MMKLRDMINTLRTAQFERIEIRDFEGNEIFTCPVVSEGIKIYADWVVTEWFPRGADKKGATFTVYVKEFNNEDTKQ